MTQLRLCGSLLTRGFPLEDYQRLVTASENGDVQALADAQKALKNRVIEEAKTIRGQVSRASIHNGFRYSLSSGRRSLYAKYSG